MSLKSLLSKIWSSIKSMFDGMPSKFKNAIHIGVVIVENIKAFIDSPITDILTDIIPGDLDDKIKNLLRTQLPGILVELKLADSCSNLTDPDQITICAIKVLNKIEGDIKNAFLHNISILVAQVASDGKLSWSDGVYLLEWYYQNRLQKQA